MALTKQWHIDKLYYSIKEVSEITGIRPANIRFYVKEMKLKVTRSADRSNRLFEKYEIKQLLLIKRLTKYCHVKGIARIIKEKKLDSSIELCTPVTLELQEVPMAKQFCET